MKVLHITKHDMPGAGGAALRLHRGLRKAGIRSEMMALHRTANRAEVTKFSGKEGRIRREMNRSRARRRKKEFDRYRHTRPVNTEIFSDDRTDIRINSNELVKAANILNLHWISRMIDAESFFPAIKDKPLVWTLHDLNPFTGGCHYPGPCRKYVTGCGACPQLGSTDKGDLSNRVFHRKRKAYGEKDIHVVAPSRWMAERAGESAIFGNKKITVIPNGVSTEIFKRIDKKFARDFLGLPGEGVVILFGAGDTATRRKGMAFLMEALEKIPRGGKTLMVFGQGQDVPDKINDIPVVFTGEVRDERMLACMYSASDVFVLPSLEDNLPNTMIEALACGTPVVGFDAGGIPEAVRPGETGLLARVGDAEDLAGKIEWIVTHAEERDVMSRNAAAAARREYTDEQQAERYVKIYREMVRR